MRAPNSVDSHYFKLKKLQVREGDPLGSRKGAPDIKEWGSPEVKEWGPPDVREGGLLRLG